MKSYVTLISIWVIHVISYEVPRMQVLNEMGQAWVDGHIPASGHHVAPVENASKGRRWYKVKLHGIVNAWRGNSAQVTAVVMAGEIQSKACEVIRDITVYDQRMLVATQVTGLSVSIRISSPSVWLIPQSALVAGGLDYPVVCWNLFPLPLVRMVRPRQ